jgi:hypothetical protein
MDDECDLACLDTDALVVQLVRGQINALGEIWRRHCGRMHSMARLDLRPFQELNRLCEADDILRKAAADLTWRALTGGLINKVSCRNDCWLLFRDVLRHCIRDAQERNSAIKRGGEGSKKRPAGESEGRIPP